MEDNQVEYDNDPNIICLNDAVVLQSNRTGIVRYISDKNQDRIAVGIELTEPNTTYIDVNKLFKCKPNHGLLIPLQQIARKIMPSELLTQIQILTNKTNKYHKTIEELRSKLVQNENQYARWITTQFLGGNDEQQNGHRAQYERSNSSHNHRRHHHHHHNHHHSPNRNRNYISHRTTRTNKYKNNNNTDRNELSQISHFNGSGSGSSASNKSNEDSFLASRSAKPYIVNDMNRNMNMNEHRSPQRTTNIKRHRRSQSRDVFVDHDHENEPSRTIQSHHSNTHRSHTHTRTQHTQHTHTNNRRHQIDYISDINIITQNNNQNNNNENALSLNITNMNRLSGIPAFASAHRISTNLDYDRDEKEKSELSHSSLRKTKKKKSRVPSRESTPRHKKQRKDKKRDSKTRKRSSSSNSHLFLMPTVDGGKGVNMTADLMPHSHQTSNSVEHSYTNDDIMMNEESRDRDNNHTANNLATNDNSNIVLKEYEEV